MASEREELFEKAAAFLPGSLGKFTQEDLLYLYGRFKQANDGLNNRPKPGFFDFQGKQKWQAWKDLGDMSKEEAMTQYIQRVEERCPGWEKQEEGEEGGGGGGLAGWVSVSTMKKPEEEEIDEEEKTLSDFVKEGNEEAVRRMIKRGGERVKADLKSSDEGGLTALHWASDRGHLGIISALLEGGADVSSADGEGQTALHYAASCGHAAACARPHRRSA